MLTRSMGRTERPEPNAFNLCPVPLLNGHPGIRTQTCVRLKHVPLPVGRGGPDFHCDPNKWPPRDLNSEHRASEARASSSWARRPHLISLVWTGRTASHLGNC